MRLRVRSLTSLSRLTRTDDDEFADATSTSTPVPTPPSTSGAGAVPQPQPGGYTAPAPPWSGSYYRASVFEAGSAPASSPGGTGVDAPSPRGNYYRERPAVDVSVPALTSVMYIHLSIHQMHPVPHLLAPPLVCPQGSCAARRHRRLQASIPPHINPPPSTPPSGLFPRPLPHDPHPVHDASYASSALLVPVSRLRLRDTLRCTTSPRPQPPHARHPRLTR